MTALFLAASGDLFSVGHNLASKIGSLLALVAIVIAGGICLGHLANHRVGAVLVTIAIAAVSLWLLANPTGAAHTLSSTISSL